MQDENGNEGQFAFYLSLYENGTFNYRMSFLVPFGYIGNYIIKDDAIVLNYLFRTTSGAGIFRTTGTKTIIINSESNLIDSNPMEDVDYLNNKPTSVNLEKDVNAEIKD